MSAAPQLTETTPTWPALTPMGIPVRGGRLHLGRLRDLLDCDDAVVVAARPVAPLSQAYRRCTKRPIGTTTAGSPQTLNANGPADP
jgi:hypothetical protein